MNTITTLLFSTFLGFFGEGDGKDYLTVEKYQMDLIVSEDHAALCGEDFDNAKAKLKIKENSQTGKTTVSIQVKNGVPDMIYTVWMFAPVSPLTGAPASPLAPTTELENLAESTPPEAGSTEGANAFWTDEDGDGVLVVTLDFLLSDGVYPYEDGDVPLGSFPFSMRVISHCTDNLSHGLLPGPHEPNFQISL